MNCRNIIYSLKNDLNDKVILSIDLTARILSEDTDRIIVDLPTGTSSISKAQYLNRMRVYTVDEKLFFLICDKKVSRESAFEVLMNHAIGKIDIRLEKLQTLKTEYSRQLQVA